MQFGPELGLRILVEIDPDHRPAVDDALHDLTAVGEALATDELEGLLARAVGIAVQMPEDDPIAVGPGETKIRSRLAGALWAASRKMNRSGPPPPISTSPPGAALQPVRTVAAVEQVKPAMAAEHLVMGQTEQRHMLAAATGQSVPGRSLDDVVRLLEFERADIRMSARARARLVALVGGEVVRQGSTERRVGGGTEQRHRLGGTAIVPGDPT